MELLLAKAHAYGNDFIYLESADLARADGPELARTLCERHTGVGADGLILFRQTSSGAALQRGRQSVGGLGQRRPWPGGPVVLAYAAARDGSPRDPGDWHRRGR